MLCHELTLQNKNFKKLVDNTIDFTVPLLSVKELNENIDDYLIFDAREKEEYNVSHIPGAKYIGYDNPEWQILEDVDTDRKVLFYCSIGYRSEKLGEKAKEMGFSQIYNLYGSIFEWVNEGYEVVDNSNNPTKKVHGYSWLWGRWIENGKYEKVYK